MNNLKPADIIAWFRSKSREYAQTAARLEKDFDMSPSDIILSDSTIEHAPLQPIIDYLRSVGAKRPADIADHVKSTKEAVVATIDANLSTFTKAERGWIKLTETAA